MSTWDLNELLDISDEQWDDMTIDEQTLVLEKLEQLLKKEGFLLEYDKENGLSPHRTVQ